MPAAPASPFGSDLSAPGVTLAVFLGPENGLPPDSSDFVDWLVPITIEQTAGGAKDDYCEFAWDLDRSGERITDLETPTKFSRQVEVRVQNDLLPPEEWQLVFWGDLTQQQIKVAQGETVTVLGRIADYHFGLPCDGYDAWDYLTNTVVRVENDPIFNPLIDGVIEENRSGRTHPTSFYSLWVNPETIRTPNAQSLAGEVDAGPWNLADAVDSTCKLLNAGIYLRNPDVVNAAILSDANPPTNISLKRGSYLPDYLDGLLPPHGFSWFVSHAQKTTDPDDPDSTLVSERQIRIFKIGEGIRREVWFQFPGSALDLDEQNLRAFSMIHDVSQLANKIVGKGSLIAREVTIELYRGWSVADDDLTLDDLSADKENFPETQYYAGKQDVWRSWLANEDGSISGLRPEDPVLQVFPTPTTPTDLSSVLGPSVPRRRALGRCLTRDADGKRLPPQLEWFTPDSVWEPAPKHWTWTVMPDRIGVYFTGPTPPQELRRNALNVRLRITGTITGDARLTATANRRESSPNAREVVLHLDLPDRFHDRQLASGDAWTGQDPSTGEQTVFTSTMDQTNGADTREDSAALQSYVDTIQTTEESAVVSATLPIFGLDFSYEIGQIITAIEGRNINFNRNSRSAATSKHLQIMGRRFLVQQQTTLLIVEPVA